MKYKGLIAFFSLALVIHGMDDAPSVPDNLWPILEDIIIDSDTPEKKESPPRRLSRSQSESSFDRLKSRHTFFVPPTGNSHNPYDISVKHDRHHEHEDQVGVPLSLLNNIFIVQRETHNAIMEVLDEVKKKQDNSEKGNKRRTFLQIASLVLAQVPIYVELYRKYNCQ